MRSLQSRLALAAVALACGLWLGTEACGIPAAPVQFSPHPAIGPFALDPASPVIARGSPGAPDEVGATAPSVYADMNGRHAIYLGLDFEGGTHLLSADEIDAGLWQKSATPVGAVSGIVGRPAAAVSPTA